MLPFWPICFSFQNWLHQESFGNLQEALSHSRGWFTRLDYDTDWRPLSHAVLQPWPWDSFLSLLEDAVRSDPSTIRQHDRFPGRPHLDCQLDPHPLPQQVAAGHNIDHCLPTHLDCWNHHPCTWNHIPCILRLPCPLLLLVFWPNRHQVLLHWLPPFRKPWKTYPPQGLRTRPIFCWKIHCPKRPETHYKHVNKKPHLKFRTFDPSPIHSLCQSPKKNWFSFLSRSTLSKLISPNEIGAAFSLIGILGKFVDLFSKPFFLFLYKATVGFFPGAAMLFLGVGFVLAILIMIRLQCNLHQHCNHLIFIHACYEQGSFWDQEAWAWRWQFSWIIVVLHIYHGRFPLCQDW